MPVTMLFVEGSLDAQILTAILGGDPVVRPGGSKNSLAPRTRVQRAERGAAICYLRDRDFDFDPPDDCTHPEVDRREAGMVLGWRWCRHEMENYLLDPEIVARATGWDQDEYEEELVHAAGHIRHYQIARWVVGVARRSLPPHYELRTRPDECGSHEFRLPANVGEAVMYEWAQDHIARHHGRIAEALGQDAVEAELARRTDALSEPSMSSPADALLWCSGKDLLAALEPWTTERGLASARSLVNKIRDWVIANPEDAVAVLSEWRALRETLRA